MRKLLKLMSMVAITFLLVACNNKEETESVESVESVESQAPVESDTESSQEISSVEESEADDESAEEPSAENVTIEFYVGNQSEPSNTYSVSITEGTNVLETMELIEEIDFNFNEEEGVIDQIGDYVNDYDTGETWTYLLNGQYAELGVVSQILEPGDTVTWYYGTIDLIPMHLIPAEEQAVELENPGQTTAADEVAEEITEEGTGE